MTTSLFHTVPLGNVADGRVNIIVEISEGSRIKYEFDKSLGAIAVDRFLHTPIPYPFSYGLLPQTWNEYDNDPLDAIIIASEPILPGVVVPCRVIGLLHVDDTGERDDKVLVVPCGDPYFATVNEFGDLPPKKREDVEYFLAHYKDLEPGKEVIVKSWESAKVARDFVQECEEKYGEKFAK